jgi:nicotinate-nucleotide adenylyltransferase
MGGTFDPVHYVHLMLAENAYRQFDLDEVIFLPSGDPPHKTGRRITPDTIRCEMLRLAVDNVPYFTVSDMEINRSGYSYSSDTLTELHRLHPDTDYYFIMGGDSVFQIESWHEPEIVMANCIILAAIRDQVSMEDFKKRIAFLTETYHADIRILNLPDIMLSSSEMRKRCHEGQSIRFMTPDPVVSYIKSNGLYQMADQTENRSGHIDGHHRN